MCRLFFYCHVNGADGMCNIQQLLQSNPSLNNTLPPSLPASLQLVNALHTMMTFKSYLPLNKIVSQALRSGNFYDIGQGAYALAHVIQVGSVLLKWQYCSVRLHALLVRSRSTDVTP
jgi:hypothetical protein